MAESNPFAPPKMKAVPQHVLEARAAAVQAAEKDKGPDDFRVEGDEVSIRNNGQLPPVCILTGEPTTRQNWDMIWKSVFATLRGRLGVHLGVEASERRAKAKTLTWIAVLLAGVPLSVGSVAIDQDLGALGWSMALSLLAIPLVPTILKLRKLYEVIDLSRTQLRIRVDPAVARALTAYRNQYIEAYEPKQASPGDAPAQAMPFEATAGVAPTKPVTHPRQ